MRNSIRSYKQLPAKDELELVLWLSFFEESVSNVLIQSRRWKRSIEIWDLHMCLIALVNVDDAVVGLKRFIDSSDTEFWKILRSFRDDVRRYKIKDLRNCIIHREKIFKLQDKKGDPFMKSPLLILGGYNFNKDEYIFGPYNIRVTDIFSSIQKLVGSVKTLFKNRVLNYYNSGSYEGIIPWSQLHGLTRIGESGN